MRNNYFKKTFIVLLFLLSINSVFSQEEKDIEGEILSFDELMNILVVTASKEEQDISDAPAIIDVITDLQIRDFGVNNLYELISMLPGIEMAETYFGRTVLNFRGINSIHYSHKVLLMINGNSLYEPINGSHFLESIPIGSIDRIEIIRGPGSSLYGTNAYAGVINVITKNGKGKTEFEAEFNYGSFSTVNGNMSFRYKINEDAGLFISGSFFQTDGYPFKVSSDEAGTAGEFDYKTEPINVFANFSFNNFSLDLGYFSLDKSHYGLVPNLNYKGVAELSKIYANAKYLMHFSDKVSATALVRYISYDNPNVSIGYFPFRGFPGHDESQVHIETSANWFSTEFQLNANLSDKLTNVSGIVFESSKSDPYQFIWDTDGALNPFTAYNESYSSNNFAGYSQFNYKVSEKTNLLAGIRVVKDKDVEDVFVLPRAGLIFKFSKNYSFKALYGKAFRAPSFFEKYVATTNVLFGKSDLLPEKIQTFDFGLEMVFSESVKARINGFYEKTSDGIVRIPTPDPDAHGPRAAVYVNSANLNLYGVELSANGLVGESAYWGLNFSWKKGENADTDDELKGFAAITGNGWLSYRFGKFVISPTIQLIGEREGTSSRVGDFTIDSYFLMNLNLAYEFKRITIHSTIKNIFDSDYTYPEYIRGLSEEVPGGPGINYQFGIRFNY